ncbi:hypothetical protein SAMN06297387_101563 [Streptomyces zhaozhouensis]|uniref:Uncharacterized protein n=1 Tax=Streptomyces zhaozhouensis TaxID=1300267 RepID=A0A286DL02_9ACTN|nr:hypothetical protein [Streptomyces zhaozhouensis]SOD59263.1 hypothetical protein SAMN06297387_101563 [Streptomyces zhaozhouensis]
MPSWHAAVLGRLRARRWLTPLVLLLVVVGLFAQPGTVHAAGAPAAAAAEAPADRAAGAGGAERPEAVAPPRAQQAAQGEAHPQPWVLPARSAPPVARATAAGPARAGLPAAHPPYAAPRTGRAPPPGS